MLPGFRFLLAAIISATSILIFGLGAAALLRAAHEEFASNPTWRAPPETVFAESEPTKPVLAALVVEPQQAEPKTPETLVSAAIEARATIAPPPEEPQEIAAPKADPASAPVTAQETARETAKSETLAETPASSERAPVQDNPVAGAAATETKIAAIDTIAAILETQPPGSEAAPVPPEQVSAPAAPETDNTSTTIATLGVPPAVAVDTPASSTPDKSAIRKQRLRARRARERRRLAALRRAQLAQQVALQPATDLFGQTIPTTTQPRPITQVHPVPQVHPIPQARPATPVGPSAQVSPLTQAR